jgi:ureidoglycolate hydrolase
LRKLEMHPGSLESFEPVAGIAVLVVAREDSPEAPEAFLLDRPIILKKGVWHGIISLSAKVELKITENLEVATEFHTLDKPLQAVLA